MAMFILLLVFSDLTSALNDFQVGSSVTYTEDSVLKFHVIRYRSNYKPVTFKITSLDPNLNAYLLTDHEHAAAQVDCEENASFCSREL
jgi:hypothetical protein